MNPHIPARTSLSLKEYQEMRNKPEPVKRKYSNVKTEVDGLKFDSKREAARYGQLRMLELAGEITGLTHHETFRLEVNGMLVCKYEADFTFWKGGKKCVEDVKSESTRKNRAYRIKVKLMLACLSIEILET